MNTNVSVIIPIYNGEKWIEACFNSILEQTALDNNIKLEVCACNDASTDNTEELLIVWKERMESKEISFKVFNNDTGKCKGVGYAKNRAIDMSSGSFLCFQDVDDVMLPDRILEQYNAAISFVNDTLIGSKFMREPKNSTERFTTWANDLAIDKLGIQIYTSHGPTIIMPTWFCHRRVYDNAGPFSECGTGTPEDLIFFYKHLDLGGRIFRIDNYLLIYRYHAEATTFSIPEENIWKIRIERLEEKVLCNWKAFTIWNAGKQGRKFFKSLSNENQKKVLALCDVDKKKIGKKYEPFDEYRRTTSKSLDIIDYRTAKPPFIICVKLGLTSGSFEKNLSELNLEEGSDYVLFS